jgi:hypothetical protein
MLFFLDEDPGFIIRSDIKDRWLCPMLKDDCVTKIYDQSTVGDKVRFILFENGTNFCCIQTLLGHKSSKTTGIYTHVRNKALGQKTSP